MPLSTLVTEVTIHRPNSVTRMQNVPVHIEARRGIYTDVEFVAASEQVAINVRLSGAERIALIEMLGGEVK
jgi:hypothetical protein